MTVKTLRCFLMVLGVITGGLIPLNHARSQPITFPGSMSIGEDDLMVRVQPGYVRSARDPSGRDRRLTDRTIRFFGMYGLTEKTALFSRIAYVDRKFDDGTTVLTDRGFNDLELFLRHTVYEQNWPRRTFSVSPYGGVELPTGDHASPGLPDDRTLGSGSTDYLAGLAVRDAALGEPHRFLNVEYQVNREHNNFQRGDEFVVNAAIKPPLASWEREGELAGVNGILEANFQWQDRHERSGSDVRDSGGTQLFLTPGLIHTTHRSIVELAVRIPVAQNLHGDALESDYGVLVGIWRNF